MAFRKPGWLMVALVSALMAGCGSKTEPSKSNFANAIEDHLEKDGRFCVGKSFKFPGLRGSVWVRWRPKSAFDA